MPWAKSKTNFALGIDCENRTSDYAMRFLSPTPNSHDSWNLYQANKTKINGDSTVIGSPKAKIEHATTTADNTRNKFIDS